jgi:hypothetical protein
MAYAEDNFRDLLSRQSRTLSAAVREYKRRYHRDPPKGFDDWWRFAKKNNVKMVDEYDGLIEDFAPFWTISGEELRRRAAQVSCHCYSPGLLLRTIFKVGFLPSIDLVRLIDGNATVENVNTEFAISDPGARAKGFRDMLQKFGSKVCDLTIIHNVGNRSTFRYIAP